MYEAPTQDLADSGYIDGCFDTMAVRVSTAGQSQTTLVFEAFAGLLAHVE